MGIARRADGARQRHLRHVTTGVADDRDRSARRLLARRSEFRAQAVVRRRAAYWMTVALAVAYKSGSFAFRARMNDARSAALFDPLRAK